MLFTFSGIFIELNPEHSSKAPTPKEITLLGNL